MDSLERIFEKFEDVNEFAGYAPKKEYRADTKEEIREKVGSGDIMDLTCIISIVRQRRRFLTASGSG